VMLPFPLLDTVRLWPQGWWDTGNYTTQVPPPDWVLVVPVVGALRAADGT